MAGHRGSSDLDRQPGIDRFDDQALDPSRDARRTPLSRLRHVVFVLFLAFLGLLGLVGAIAVISILAILHSVRSNLSIDLASPASDGLDIALSHDGSVAYVTEPSDNSLLVLDAATGRLLTTVAVGNTPSGLAVSADGSQVWVVNTSLAATPPPGTESPTDNARPSGPQPSSGLGSVSVVSTTTEKVLATIPVGLGPIDVAFSPDGRQAFVTDNGILSPGSVSVIDTATLTVVGTLPPSNAPSAGPSGWHPTSVAVTPDGRQVWVSEVDPLSSSESDDVDVFDASTDAQMATIPIGTGPYFMILSRDGREAYVADKESCDLRQIDTATFRVTATVHWPKADGCPFGLAAGPNDDVVYTVTGNDHTIDEGRRGNVFGAVDFRTSQVLVHSHVGSDPVTVTLSPSGWAAYVVDADLPVVEVLNPVTGATTSTFGLPPHREAAASIPPSTLR